MNAQDKFRTQFFLTLSHVLFSLPLCFSSSAQRHVFLLALFSRNHAVPDPVSGFYFPMKNLRT